MQLQANLLIEKHEEHAIDELIIKERNSEIHELSKDITDIHQIMHSLNEMVHHQAEGIEHIDAAIEESLINTEKGVIDLQKADEYVQSSRSMLFKGAIVSGGVLAGGIVLFPFTVVGGAVASVLGVGGLAVCIGMGSNKKVLHTGGDVSEPATTTTDEEI